MSHLRTLLPATCIVMMILSVAPAAAEVVWDHTLTDLADDVISVLEPNVKLSDKGEIDILLASIADQGDDINVTLTLAGAHNSEATYQVYIVCDGDDAKTYTFSYFPYTEFIIDGFDVFQDSPEAYVSEDGTKLSWVISKDKITATAKVEVSRAESSVLSGMTNYVDSAPDEGNGGNGGNGGSGSGEPVNVQVHIEFVKGEHVRYIIEMVIEGEDAKDKRGEFDTDVDGTVTKAEYDQHIDFYYLTFTSWNDTDIKLNGGNPVTKAMTFELEGVIGSASSTSPVTQVVVLDVKFPEVAEAQTNTYAGFLSSIESAGEMWDVTADSLWLMTATSGWKYKTDDWPSDLKTYLNSKDTTVTMSGLQMQSDWNTTMGVMSSLVITEKGGDGDGEEEESPGFGASIVLLGLLSAMALAGLGRRLLT